MLKIIHDLATSSLSKETKQKEKVGELAEMAKCEEERERETWIQRQVFCFIGWEKMSF